MKFKTLSVHAGQGPEPLHGAVMTPVYQSSTFAFEDADKPREFDYSRSGNPTRKALETCLAALENGTRAFAFASGMAAEATLMALYGAGDHIILSDECYGGTYRLAMNTVKKNGIDVSLVDLNDLDAVRAAITPEHEDDLDRDADEPADEGGGSRGARGLARERGIETIVDNTFLSPYFQNPLDLGIDIVMHSTTKYINGHSDVIGGAAIVRDRGTWRPDLLPAELDWARCRGRGTAS
jgi:cystathionine beta-lyase/cystathionine gamma-synthase